MLGICFNLFSFPSKEAEVVVLLLLSAVSYIMSLLNLQMSQLLSASLAVK